MDLTELISNFVTATLIVLTGGVVLYSVVTTTGERAQVWLARRRPFGRRRIADCLSSVFGSFPAKPAMAAAGQFRSEVEPGLETSNRQPPGDPSSHHNSERRRYRRYRTGFLGALQPSAEARPANLCDILDISASGARIRPVDPMPPASRMMLGLAQFGMLPAQVVWRRDDEIGLRFEQAPMHVAYTMRGLLPLPTGAP